MCLQEQKLLGEAIVATGMSKKNSFVSPFLFILLKDAEKMFMTIIRLPHNNPYIFPFGARIKSPKADGIFDCHHQPITFNS